MVSDEVRREIANGLHRLADGRHNTGVPDSEILDVLEISPADTPNCSDACDVEILADLIDRPTCKNLGLEEGTNGEGYDFFCSRCGFAADVTDPKHCPECGAEVVE